MIVVMLTFFVLASDPTKGPQQRMNILHFHDPYSLVKDARRGPPVTVHKHSRANAFSICRQQKRSTKRTVSGDSGTQNPSTRSSHIMLAPRRVQEQYTSTTTTRRLDTHGLLEDRDLRHGGDADNESGGNSKSDAKDKREKERQVKKRLESELLGIKKPKKDKKSSKKNKKGGDMTSSVTSQTSSSGSAQDSLAIPPPPVSAPTHAYPPSARRQPSTRSLRPVSSPGSTSEGSTNNYSHSTGETTLSDEPIRPPRSRSRRRNDSIDSDDDSDGGPPSRTPYSETYATIDPSVIEHMRQRHDQRLPDSDSSSNFLRRLMRPLQSNVRSDSYIPGPASATLEGSYRPPWLTTVSRQRQEEQERVVTNLNTSFKDVGLLPSTKSVHKSKSEKRFHQKSANSSDSQVNIFEEVPSTSLYMLLPLWPGETDPISEKQYPTASRKPHIPMHERQYLLVYYVPFRGPNTPVLPTHYEYESGSKKKSRSSQTSSPDPSPSKKADDQSVFLTSFHVNARLVGYEELRSSGVRVPEEGLSVTGPMSEALETMPSPTIRKEQQTDWVIASCYSREYGIEFHPEGLVKMGLCHPTPEVARPVLSAYEHKEEDEPELFLSPVGRAAVEMAWVGCMALTSFGTAT